MKDLNKFIILKDSTIQQAMKLIDLNGVGSLIVVDNKKKILGVISDGNIRRAIISGAKLTSTINKFYSKKIIKFSKFHYSIKELEKISLDKGISIIPIEDNEGRICDYYSIKKKILHQ